MKLFMFLSLLSSILKLVGTIRVLEIINSELLGNETTNGNNSTATLDSGCIQFGSLSAIKGPVSMLTKEYDLARYVTSLIQASDKLVQHHITDQGYLQTKNILDCMKLSRGDNIVGRLTEKLKYEAYTGVIVSKSAGLGCLASAGSHIGNREDINKHIKDSGIEIPNECVNLTTGVYGLLSSFDGTRVTNRLEKIQTATNVYCPLYDTSIIKDHNLLKTRINRIFNYLLYFKEGDPRHKQPETKISCGNMLTTGTTYNSLPSYFSEGMRLYLNKNGENYPNPTTFTIDFGSDVDCESLTMNTMKKLGDFFNHVTVSNSEKPSVELSRGKRSPFDFIYGSSSEAEIIQNININSANVKKLYDWSLGFKSNLEHMYSTQQAEYNAMKENASILTQEAHGADLEIDLAINMIFLQLHGARESMEIHTNLLGLERLEGNLLRIVASLGRTVTGRSICQLGYGSASCSKGKPTIQIENSVLKISTIEEKIDLKMADKFACVPTKFGISARQGASVIHKSSDGKLMLSNGKIVMTEPQENEFQKVEKHSLPMIEHCFFNSDFNKTYLISCNRKTYITLKNTNVVLEKFEVLSFTEDNFPLQMGHRTVMSTDVQNLINIFSGLQAAKQLTIHEDYSPITFGHLVEEIGEKNKSTTRWEFDLPELIERHPTVLHYVSVTAVFLIILAIFVILYLLRLIIANWVSIRNFFLIICSCQWLLQWLGYKSDNEQDYLEVPTAPDREMIETENLRMSRSVTDQNRPQTRSNVFRPRQPAFAPGFSSPDTDETPSARERREKRQREVAKARRIVSQYGMDNNDEGQPTLGLSSSEGVASSTSAQQG